MYSDREILYFLQTIPGFGSRTIRCLWNHFQTGMGVFEAGEEALKMLLKPSQLRAFLREREKQTPTERIQGLQKKGIGYYSIFDWQYPKRMRMVADAPLALFVKGKLPSEQEMTASVIGARYHSYYGERNAREYAAFLAENGVSVVSGMAKGIDSIAQLSAIENGGTSYAVLGCGVDVCYPKESRRLYDMLPEHGGIISEYVPGTVPQAGLFPQRNRIISALGDILLVMEAKEKSGTLITVDMALEQGKEIWALPGRTDDVLSLGCNRLIAQGAGILTGLTDFAKELECLKEKYAGEVCGGKRQEGRVVAVSQNETGESDTSKSECGLSIWGSKQSELEKRILSQLSYVPLSTEAVYEGMSGEGQASCSIQELSMLLVDLCVAQKIKQVSGGFYVRK